MNSENDKKSVAGGFVDGLIRMAKKYRNIVVLSADFGQRIGIEKFSRAFPERYFNLGLQESNMISIATGFCVTGKLPIIVGFANFWGKAYEQIRNGICLPNLNIKIAAISTGIMEGQYGVGYQVTADVACMRALPNMKVVAPADYFEASSCIETALDDFGPVYFRMPNVELPLIFDESYKFYFGKSQVLKDGNDVCIFAMGNIISNCLKAAEIFENEGVKVSVVNVSSIKPIDKDLIVECSKKSKLLVTIEDHNVIGGLHSAVSEVLSEKSPAILKKIGIFDRFAESSRGSDLYRKYELDENGIVSQIKSFLKNS